MEMIILIIILASSVQVRGACDYCQPQNSVACHSENVFSLCIDGIATHDYITCPNNYVCTQDYLVCYPKEGAVVSCARDVITSDKGGNLCGVCEPRQKVFSCINETTIAFCFGNDLPVHGSLAHCPPNTVCDLDNSKEFCTEKTKATPSCRQLSDGEITTTTEVPVTTTTSAEKSTTPTAEDSTTDESTTATEGDTSTEQPTSSITGESTTDKSTTTNAGDTTTEQPTTKPFDPNAVCQGKDHNGSYKIESDPTCTTYLYCWKTNGLLKGSVKSCLKGEYFNDSLGKCDPNKPVDCK